MGHVSSVSGAKPGTQWPSVDKVSPPTACQLQPCWLVSSEPADSALGLKPGRKGEAAGEKSSVAKSFQPERLSCSPAKDKIFWVIKYTQTYRLWPGEIRESCGTEFSSLFLFFFFFLSFSSSLSLGIFKLRSDCSNRTKRPAARGRFARGK